MQIDKSSMMQSAFSDGSLCNLIAEGDKTNASKKVLTIFPISIQRPHLKWRLLYIPPTTFY